MKTRQSKTLMLTIMVPCHEQLPEQVQAFIRQNLQQHIEQEFNVDYEPTWVEPAWAGPPVTGPAVVLSKVIDTTTYELPAKVSAEEVADALGATPVKLADLIAGHFLRLLRQDIGPDNYAEACVRNLAEKNTSICHSHDFCDANMTMQAAFLAVGRNPDVDDEADVDLWGEAWAIAFRAMQLQAGGH